MNTRQKWYTSAVLGILTSTAGSLEANPSSFKLGLPSFNGTAQALYTSTPLTFDHQADWSRQANPWPATTLTTIERWESMGENLPPDPGSPANSTPPVRAKRVVLNEIPEEIRLALTAKEYTLADQQIAKLLIDGDDAPFLRATQVLARWAAGDPVKASFSLWRLLTLRTRYDFSTWVLNLESLLGSPQAVTDLLEKTTSLLSSPDLPPEEKVRVQVLLGWGWIQIGRHAEARAILEQALATRPASRQIMTLLRMLPPTQTAQIPVPSDL